MSKKKEKVVPYLLIIPSVCGTFIFFIVPLVYVIFNSLSTPALKIVSFENYKTVIMNDAFRLALKNSYIFSFISVTVLYFLSIAMTGTILFYTKGKFTKRLKMGFAIAVILPVTTTALGEIILFEKQGMVNGVLDSLQISTPNWLESNSVFFILMISFIWKNIGLAIVLWSAGINSISESIVEAAQSDGANKVQCFLNIILPNLNKTKYLVLLYFVIQSFKGFREMYLISGDYPHERAYFLQNIFNNWFRDMDIGTMAAGTVINIGILLVIIYLIEKMTHK